MPSNSRFFGNTGFLWPLAKLFMSIGVIGVIFAFVTRKQNVLSWSAISVGVGLALGFFREAFGPRTQLDEHADKAKVDSDSDKSSP
jgi:hypothetical protein